MLASILIFLALVAWPAAAELTVAPSRLVSPPSAGALACDNSTDDTAALQAAVNDAISTGQRVVLPQGDCLFSDTITIVDVRGLTFECQGMQATRLKWTGSDSSKHFFALEDVRDSVFRGCYIGASASGEDPTVGSIFFMTNGPGGVPSNRTFANIAIECTNGGCINAFEWSDTGSAGNANNDLDLLIGVQIRNVRDYGFLIGHTQSKTHTFLHSTCSGGISCIRSAGSFRWYGGAGGGGTSGAFFHQTTLNDTLLISGCNLENANRLFWLDGNTTGAQVLTIENCRFSASFLNEDGVVIRIGTAGPTTIRNNAFQGDSPVTIILTNGGGVGTTAEISGNNFFANDLTENPYNITSDPDNQITIYGSNFTGGSGGVDSPRTFADEDATPSVFAGEVFRAVDTDSVTMTDMDDPWDWARKTVFFTNSNRTVDFTDSGLVGNGGVDWSPGAGDHMECIWNPDTTDWHCSGSW